MIDRPNGEDVTRYYTYTVKELNMTYASGDTDGNAETRPRPRPVTRCPSSTARDKDGKYVATVTNSVPLPETGGNGTLLFVMLGVLMLALGTAWYCAPTEPAAAGERARNRPVPQTRSAHPITRLPAVARRRGNQCNQLPAPTGTGAVQRKEQ